MSYGNRTRRRPNTSAPTDGSRTIVLHDSQPREEGADEGAGSSGPRAPDGVLRLRGGPDTRPHVVWSEDVIDNEGMGKKKSKICCIYHKPKAFDESSSDESSSDDESDSPGGNLDRAQPPRRPHRHQHRHNHDHPHRSDSGDSNTGPERVREAAGNVVVEELHEEPDVNAYERQPRKGKAPAKN